MIEHRPFDQLPSEFTGGLKATRHFVAGLRTEVQRAHQGCVHQWNDEEMSPETGFPLQDHANVEIIIYVREGTLTHTDNLGNEGRVEAGHIQVISAGIGIRNAEYNLERTTAKIFRLWITPASPGGAPAWAVHPCSAAEQSGCFVPIASGLKSDRGALPIRARARVLNAKLKTGQTFEYPLRRSRFAYLVSSRGSVDINGIRIHARDGVAISDVGVITISAIHDADLVMVDVL